MPLTPSPTLRHLLLLAIGLLTAGLLAACGAEQDGGEATTPTDDTPTTDGTDPAETTGEASDPGDTGSDPDAQDPAPSEGSGADGIAPDEASAAAVEALAFTTCEAEPYTVGYPRAWNTNGDDGLLGPCTTFHPGDIDVPEQPRDRDLHYAVSMYVDEVEFDDLVPSDTLNELINERETTVDGRRARVMEFRSTGEALTPAGEYSYTWAVDLGGQLLVATTSSVGETDYERDKRVIDRMMRNELTIHDEATSETSMVAGPSTTSTSRQEPDGGPLAVTDVRVGAHGSFDRLVFEIAGDGRAGWLTAYVDDPRSQGSGNPVAIDGDAVLRVTLRDMAYPGDAPAAPYDGPERITPPASANLIEVVEDTLFEGHHDFFVGLDEERPYRVERLTDPQRIVIDIEAD